MSFKTAIANNYESAAKALAKENEANDKANYDALEAYNKAAKNYKHAVDYIIEYYDAKTTSEKCTKCGCYDDVNKANIIIANSYKLFNDHYKVGNTAYEVGNKAIANNIVASNATKRARTKADAYFNAYNTLIMLINVN